MKKNNFNQTIAQNINIVTLLIFLFFSSTIIYAQVIPTLNVTLKLKVKDGDLKNSRITITKKGAPYKVIEPEKGGYAVDLTLGYEFEFTYTKVGYITKIILVNTHVPEHREKGIFAKQISEVELEKQPDDHAIHHSLPSARIAYSDSKGDFDFEKNYDPKAEKANKNEKNSSAQKSKSNSSAITQNKSTPIVVKQSETKLETPSYKPAVKNRVEKIIQQDDKKTTIITITIGGKDFIYRKEEYSWGVYFYKDNKSITENTFSNETQ